jgi:hypothetical protein
MATAELMTWNKTQRRWFKMYRGKMFAVSPKQLNRSPSKEQSRVSANAWWERKQAEIDEQFGKAKQHPAGVVNRYALAIRNHRVYSWWHRREGDIEQAVKSEQAVEWLQEALKQDDPPKITYWDFDPAWEEKRDCGIVSIALWSERLAEWERIQQAETGKPKQDTIRGHIDDYLATRKAQAEASNKLQSYETQRQRLTKFREWLDPLARIETLNENLWERYCLHLSKQVQARKLAPATMQGIQIAVRSFVKTCWEKRFIELPRNLTARNLSAQVPLQELEVFTPAEIKQLIDNASPRKQLYLLLMLNCGMYPVDISELRQNEVDWDKGTISRK